MKLKSTKFSFIILVLSNIIPKLLIKSFECPLKFQCMQNLHKLKSQLQK